MLSLPDGTNDLINYYDTSRKDLGCVLTQKNKVITYASRRSKAEKKKNYIVLDLEYGTITFAPKVWEY